MGNNSCSFFFYPLCKFIKRRKKMEAIITGVGLVLIGLFGILVKLFPKETRNRLREQLDNVDGE